VASNLLDHPEVRGGVVNQRPPHRKIEEKARGGAKDQLIAELKQTLAGLEHAWPGYCGFALHARRFQEESGELAAKSKCMFAINARVGVFPTEFCPNARVTGIPEQLRRKNRSRVSAKESLARLIRIHPLADLRQEIRSQTCFVFCRSEQSGFFRVARDVELRSLDKRSVI